MFTMLLLCDVSNQLPGCWFYADMQIMQTFSSSDWWRVYRNIYQDSNKNYCVEPHDMLCVCSTRSMTTWCMYKLSVCVCVCLCVGSTRSMTTWCMYKLSVCVCVCLCVCSTRSMTTWWMMRLSLYKLCQWLAPSLMRSVTDDSFTDCHLLAQQFANLTVFSVRSFSH